MAKLSYMLSSYDGLSRPLFLHVPEAYHQAPIKLMVVGQQTYGWGEQGMDRVDALIALYQDFDLGRRYTRSPFWQAAHKLCRDLNPGGPEYAFLWSNLVKVDQWRDRPSLEVEASVSQCGLLQQEIAITTPDAVVFFTGPQYDARLKSSFPSVEYEAVSSKITRLKHSGLPVSSFKTYHPNYLRRSRRWSVLDDIAVLIRADQRRLASDT